MALSIEQLADAMMRYLDCPCRVFEPMRDDDPIMEAYNEAKTRGESEGFTPVLVVVDDTLMECLATNAVGWDNVPSDFAVDMDSVRAYRRNILLEPMTPAEKVLELLSDSFADEVDELGLDFGAEIDTKAVDTVEDYEPDDRFHGYWDFASRKTCPLILAEIPTVKPWEIFAWLPFGNWNECPDTKSLMAITKKWYELHGAVPAVMTHDVLEFELPQPVAEDKAMELVREQYLWCPDCIESVGGDFTPAILAAILTRSRVWSFWWD